MKTNGRKQIKGINIISSLFKYFFVLNKILVFAYYAGNHVLLYHLRMYDF